MPIQDFKTRETLISTCQTTKHAVAAQNAKKGTWEQQIQWEAQRESGFLCWRRWKFKEISEPNCKFQFLAIFVVVVVQESQKEDCSLKWYNTCLALFLLIFPLKITIPWIFHPTGGKCPYLNRKNRLKERSWAASPQPGSAEPQPPTVAFYILKQVTYDAALCITCSLR